MPFCSGQAVIHLRMLTLFGMVTRLPSDPLAVHARNVLTCRKATSKSWFLQLRDISMQYQLPHPLSLLDYPPTKETYGKLIRSRVMDFWETKLRGEASLIPSLQYFQPNFMSLSSPHPVWATAGSNPYEISKAIQQARFFRAVPDTATGSSISSNHCSHS